METDFKDIPAPVDQPSTLTVDQAQFGNPIPPQQQIQLYEPGNWETFTEEWVHYCLKPVYWKVQRFTGSGDKGIDIAGFTDPEKARGDLGQLPVQALHQRIDADRCLAGIRQDHMVQLYEGI